jgi:hypothetical protein
MDYMLQSTSRYGCSSDSTCQLLRECQSCRNQGLLRRTKGGAVKPRITAGHDSALHNWQIQDLCQDDVPRDGKVGWAADTVDAGGQNSTYLGRVPQGGNVVTRLLSLIATAIFNRRIARWPSY